MSDLGVGFALSAARGVYLMMCQLNINQEDFSALALRVNLLIGCLTTTDLVRRGNGSEILNEINGTIEKIRTLVNEFSHATKQRKFLWSKEYAKRCNNLNTELTHYVQVSAGNKASCYHYSHSLPHGWPNSHPAFSLFNALP